MRFSSQYPRSADKVIYADILFLLIGKIIGRKGFMLCFRRTYQLSFFVKYGGIKLWHGKRTLYACKVVDIKHIGKTRSAFFKFGQLYVVLFAEFVIYKVVARCFKVGRYIAHRSLKTHRSAILCIYRLARKEKPVIFIVHHKTTMRFKTLFLVL